MNVLHFNASLKGGAAIAALRICNSLKPFVEQMTFYSLTGDGGPDHRKMPGFQQQGGVSDLVSRLKWSMYYRKLNQVTAGKLNKYEKFTPAEIPIKTTLPVNSGQPDLIHLHWTSDMINHPSFFASVPNNLPVVFTCHDMNPFTGGCHYTWGCDKFAKNCGNCPQLAVSGTNDLSAKTHSIKTNVLHNKQVHVVGNSYWIEEQAKKSRVFASAKSFQTVHYPIDTELFKPLDKAAAKAILGLPADARVVSFGAERFDNQRKGFKPLLQALERIKENIPALECLVFGGGNAAEGSSQSLPLRYMGFVGSGYLQRIIYSASDVFIIPSLEEAFGQTALEAMACGTPVVGFETGGIVDMIEHGKTGYLATCGDANSLAEQITAMLNNDEQRVQMGKNAREKAVDNFNEARQGALYFEVYKNALGIS